MTMTIKEMQDRKRELGYTNELLSQISGVPLSTIQKILGGQTRSPRRTTILALEKALAGKSRTFYPSPDLRASVLRDPASSYGTAAEYHTIADIEALPEDERAELIDGQIYYMSAPLRVHQSIIVEILFAIKSHIRSHNGSCEVYPSPFGVYLNGEEGQDLLEPDLLVVCNPDILHQKGCMGAPDWVMEVVSPSTESRDYGIKLFKYRSAGVKEYWIVNPQKRIVTVYQFDRIPEIVNVYSFEETIPFALFPGLSVRPADFV